MDNSHLHLKIAGTGMYVPPTIVGNEVFTQRDLYKYDLDGKVRILDETGRPVEHYVGGNRITTTKIEEMCGIKERRYALPDKSPSDLAYYAAVLALQEAQISPESLEGIIFATITERPIVPCAASKLQRRLKIKKDRIFVEDKNMACAGFVGGIITANGLAANNPGNYLIIGADLLHTITDPTDYNSILFADGAGAMVLVPIERNISDNRVLLKTYYSSNPSDDGIGCITTDSNGLLRMSNGGRVLKSAIGEMCKSVKVLTEELGWSQFQLCIPHQANERILSEVEKKMSQYGASIFRNIQHYGNTSSASSIIALDEARKTGAIKQGYRVIMTTFGADKITTAAAFQF